uniref:Protein HGH1 N-terminal domain-containing protein n=1 Tax=Pyramimonas obovata TaxID=1411642 RepID=A0A7S0QSZ1_9CHLO|mmetsp:Transcript_1332/g.2663  ORF Transcript_1332/g.2663 Transcript_1332/m.2663 type:complete len:349 (+) Transcript_1332:160-1206(+)|eukprot:CAMPEP_0118922446 /NCGR_PEP_ID=MMETSP1169-20130426/1368_1 /TAXON_ID=36882 /ORGANISM="Pyramimonas obovata, Strain CCMP722" /LENGTH=348 /DNA_ID=CAMNT_0006863313 /DNA_START=66 /DNA_END=1112 /DNA_ORIENTATION=+
MGDELVELVEFLSHEKAAVRLQAVKIVNGVAASDDGPQQLAKIKDKLVPPLLRLLGGSDEEAETASSALVNLSTEPQHCENMVRSGVIGRVMEQLKDPKFPCREGMAMLLSNVTLVESGSKKFLQVGEEDLEGLYLAQTMGLIIGHGKTGDDWDDDQYQLRHLPAVLPHVCRFPEGRELLLHADSHFLQHLIPQLQSKVVERRRSIATMLKNICMDKKKGVPALLTEGGATLLPAMLHPISGKDPREADEAVRQAVAEAVQLLAGSEEGFDQLWTAGAPELLRAGYVDEEGPGVCEAMESTAELFMTHNSDDLGEGGAKIEQLDDDGLTEEENRRLAELSEMTIKTTI